MFCILCGRSTTNDAYTYNVMQHSASQGSANGAAAAIKDHINVCASCNYYFDGTSNGMTQNMTASAQMISGGPFRELPKDVMLVWLASACSGAEKESLSGWFPKMIKAMSGDTSFWNFRI